MMARNVARWKRKWAVAIGSCCVLASAIDAQGSGGESCPGVRWTAPRPWRSPEGHDLFASVPSIVPVRGGTLWLSQGIVVRSSPTRMVWPLLQQGDTVVTSPDEIQIGVWTDPAGAWRYVPMPPHVHVWPDFIRVAVDSRGVAHVLWAAIIDTDLPHEIWYARLDGERWSEPIVIAANHRFNWNSGGVSLPVMWRDTLHILVHVGDRLLYLRGVDDAWSSRILSLPDGMIPGGYPGLAVLPSGRLVILYQGPATDTPKRTTPGLQLTSRVYAAWSDDGGASWRAARSISSLASEPAFDFHLFGIRENRLLAVWYQRTDSLGRSSEQFSPIGTPGRLQIAESRDRGESWRLLAPSALVANALGLTVLALGDTMLVAALVDQAAEKIVVSTWADGWRPFALIDADPNPQLPTLGRGDAQRLVLTWGTEQTSPERFLSIVTTLTRCP